MNVWILTWYQFALGDPTKGYCSDNTVIYLTFTMNHNKFRESLSVSKTHIYILHCFHSVTWDWHVVYFLLQIYVFLIRKSFALFIWALVWTLVPTDRVFLWKLVSSCVRVIYLWRLSNSKGIGSWEHKQIYIGSFLRMRNIVPMHGKMYALWGVTLV